MKKQFKPSVMLNPVPAVFVTTRSKSGKDNVFTVAWTGTVCTKPPMLYISVRKERKSYENILENPNFTVNIPTKSMTELLDYCGVVSAKNKDKIKEKKIKLVDGTNNCSYMEDCKIVIECKVNNKIELGTHVMILADVINILIEDDMIDDKGKIDFVKANLISYSHGEYFSLEKRAIGKFGYSVAKKKRR